MTEVIQASSRARLSQKVQLCSVYSVIFPLLSEILRILSHFLLVTDVMDWLAYSENETLFDDLDASSIVIALADKTALGIVTTSVPSVNFSQTIQMFASAIKEGKLPLQVEGYKVWVKSLASCSDKSCNDIQTLAVSDKPPWNGAARISHGNIGRFGVTAAVMLFMNKLFF